MKDKHKTRAARKKRPAVSAQSMAPGGEHTPRSRPGKTGAKATGCPPRPVRTRSASPWDPEPIFHTLVDELSFDPRMAGAR